MDFQIASELFERKPRNQYEAESLDQSPYIVDEAFFVTAVTDDGRRWQHERVFETVQEAEQLLTRIERARGKINKTHWFASHPVYGSREYERREPEIVAAHRRLGIS